MKPGRIAQIPHPEVCTEFLGKGSTALDRSACQHNRKRGGRQACDLGSDRAVTTDEKYRTIAVELEDITHALNIGQMTQKF